MNSVTGKFKIGDEVIILKAKYAGSCLQPGDLGIVKEVDVDGYSVAKKSDPAQVCFKRESFIDFADSSRRTIIPQRKSKRITDWKAARLKIIRERAKVYQQRVREVEE